ncbi:hypothetical protein GCM10011584_08520 [Nocardioides phosphati]|uniref:N-acetyltransferase domain-containing protein n=1 Tax=Nocardioides phosphati TaxID=1867775 RepID=A0ABQ2N7R8_9ACTN|nr:GNAT family N-acetyltransferase [Nocardioides phosphati]GGO86372.1 hypothetical protein GCM10011584_08520 [Nocardioides phosphati]
MRHRKPRTTVVIRRATPADVDGVLAVGRATWPPTYGPLVGDAYVDHVLASWWTPESTHASIERGVVWVADDGGEVVGMASYGLRERTATIGRLYVRPERQREGVGEALLAKVLGAVAGTADRVTLAFMDGNEAARLFYGARGFVETRRETDALGGPDDVWMELDLRR